jgi:hypothetical protein
VLSPSGSTDKAEVLSALDPTCSAHCATSACSTATSRMTIRLSPSVHFGEAFKAAAAAPLPRHWPGNRQVDSPAHGLGLIAAVGRFGWAVLIIEEAVPAYDVIDTL